MNNQISRLVDILYRSFEISLENGKVYELSIYISIKYALLSQKHSPVNGISSDSFYNVLNCKYPKLIYIYESIERELKTTGSDITDILLSLIHSEEEEDAIIISNIYQHIKSQLLSGLIPKKTGIDKKYGKGLLYQTQFFTDRYMADYLIDRIFEIYSDVENVLFVDPASGGGNFLALIYGKLYNWYSAGDFDTDNISRKIFLNNILGYDLDSELSEIAGLSLFLLAYNNDGFDSVDNVYNFGGLASDNRGFLNDRIRSNSIGGKSFDDIIHAARSEGRHIVYVTNPPFMGKRDMDSGLKAYLQAQLPMAKGDLCFSFMLKMMKNLRTDDTLAVVAQNGWMTLSSLKEFRLNVLNNFCLLDCMDLGSNAFKNINGEKTNVALAVFTKKDSSFANQLSSFGNLRSLSLPEKIGSIELGNYPVYNVDTEEFRKNNRFEFNYQLGEDLQLFAKYSKYGNYAKCMQGTSTGDNRTMVKYIWEIDSPEWKPTSKGGGFSKWEGLNFYKVKWGESGEYIKNQKGGVLRNTKEIPFTQLVFSDTGTLGLNVRVKPDDQVFIASGPGIRILKGDVFCHLAFLNSKLASYFMKIINPKFTISGGYIQKLPVAKGILENDRIRSLSQKCLSLKHAYLCNKLPNAEYRHVDYSTITDVQSYIETCIRSDFQNMYERLVAERLIDSIILSKYSLSKRLRQDYLMCMSGYEGHDDVSDGIDTGLLDLQLSKMIGASCFPIGRKVEGKLIGSENCLEILSYRTKLSCRRLFEHIYNHVSELNGTIRLYKRDLIHKMILHVCGINDLNHAISVSINPKKLNKVMNNRYPLICSQLKIDEKILSTVLKDTHNKVFFNKPILTIE